MLYTVFVLCCLMRPSADIHVHTEQVNSRKKGVTFLISDLAIYNLCINSKGRCERFMFHGG